MIQPQENINDSPITQKKSPYTDYEKVFHLQKNSFINRSEK